MKASPIDFLLSGLAITFLLAGSASLTLLLVVPISREHLSDYHVIVDFLFFLLSYGVLSGVLVRMMVKVRPLNSGEFSMNDSADFTYWKLLTMILSFGEFSLKPLTPLVVRPLIARLFGAKIGANPAIGGTIESPFMVEIGDNILLGNGSLLSPNMSHCGRIRFGKIRIGSNVTIGVNAFILPDCEIGDNVTLAPGSVVMPGTNIPTGEAWKGNPARKWTAS